MTGSEQSDSDRLVWRGRDISRMGDLGDALCQLRTPEDAAEFWAMYVEFLSRPSAKLCGRTAVDVAGENIGYLMGYYGREERQRVYGLFPQASHPIFGHDFGRGYDPTPEEAFEAGKRWGSSS